MFRCYNVVKLVRTNSGSFRKNNAIIIRNYDKPFKRPTMSDLPVPSGSWAKNYAKRNRQNNILLLVGTGVFGATLTYAIKSGIITDWGRGPGLAELEPREPFFESPITENIELTNADTQKTQSASTAKESSKSKSEEGLHTVEVLNPVVASEELSVESKETEELESPVEEENSSSKDVVMIFGGESYSGSPLSSSPANEGIDNNSSPNA